MAVGKKKKKEENPLLAACTAGSALLTQARTKCNKFASFCNNDHWKSKHKIIET
jgi:hypothetical protein